MWLLFNKFFTYIKQKGKEVRTTVQKLLLILCYSFCLPLSLLFSTITPFVSFFRSTFFLLFLTNASLTNYNFKSMEEQLN
jgi:hypothetical protein